MKKKEPEESKSKEVEKSVDAAKDDANAEDEDEDVVDAPEDTSAQYKQIVGLFQKLIDQTADERNSYLDKIRDLEVEKVGWNKAIDKSRGEWETDKLVIETHIAETTAGERIPLNLWNMKNMGKDWDHKKEYTCPICFCDDYSATDVIVMKCKHIYCKDCMKNYIVNGMKNRKAGDLFPCMTSKCTQQIQPNEAGYCLSKKELEEFHEVLFDEHLKRDKNTRWCPKCNVAMLGEKGMPMLTCPGCKYKFCFNCNTEEWHEGSTCAAFQRWKKENAGAADAFSKWKADNTKTCPKCEKNIQKNGGCDHMTCRCGYEFYWSNLQPYP